MGPPSAGILTAPKRGFCARAETRCMSRCRVPGIYSRRRHRWGFTSAALLGKKCVRNMPVIKVIRAGGKGRGRRVALTPRCFIVRSFVRLSIYMFLIRWIFIRIRRFLGRVHFERFIPRGQKK